MYALKNEWLSILEVMMKWK